MSLEEKSLKENRGYNTFQTKGSTNSKQIRKSKIRAFRNDTTIKILLPTPYQIEIITCTIMLNKIIDQVKFK